MGLFHKVGKMSITKPQGFVAAGINSGIKDNGNLDLALVALEDTLHTLSGANDMSPQIVATAVFTTNKSQAAPVLVSKEHLKQNKQQAKAVILNSGCANAATGEKGKADALEMCKTTASSLGIDTSEVLVCSTGLIGYDLPMEKILSGIPNLVKELSVEAGTQAAKAIMTTDTKHKEHFETGDGFTVGGMAKGAAMLEPNMATMLAVITTDATCENPETNMTEILKKAVASSFNKMSVDGVQSTNDTVILLSNGRAGEKPVAAIAESVQKTCEALAYMMADDAEGATKVVKLFVSGARDEASANQLGKYLANSLLLKCSWYGADPYWGRLVSEIGAFGVEADKLSLSYGENTIFKNGEKVELSEAEQSSLDKYMSGKDLEIGVDLGVGTDSTTILTTDLGHGYIDENSQTS